VKNRALRFCAAASLAAYRHQFRAIPNLARESLSIMVQIFRHAPFECMSPFLSSRPLNQHPIHRFADLGTLPAPALRARMSFWSNAKGDPLS
jgi:hypothetical protein